MTGIASILMKRARCKQEYHPTQSGTRWIDTLSLHMSVGGISNQQRPDYSTWKKVKTAYAQEPSMIVD
jgi:DNA polymerase gamma 1